MTLNETLRFEDADETVKRAFRGVPAKMLLEPRVRLYKWTNITRIDGSRITPWWSLVDTTRLPDGTTAEGFRTAEERAARLRKSHREFARARVAVSNQFRNTMTDLVMIMLLLPAWGFAGRASGQPEFARDQLEKQPDLRHVYLIGGAPQVWLPNLTPSHFTTIPAVG
jgi:hypothetical protein